MREVNKDEFYKRIGGPENIHPRFVTHTYPYTFEWEAVDSRVLVGKSVGYIEGGELKHRYYLL